MAMAEFKDKYGREFTWAQFQKLLRRCVYQRYGQGLHADWTDDALAEVVVDMLEHWVHYKKSINDDGTLNLGYALQNGLKRFGRFYAREQRQYSPSDGLLRLVGQEAFDPTEEEFFAWLETIDSVTVDEWLGVYDGSQEDQAARAGVSQPTVSRRNAKRNKAMKRAWSEYAKRL